MKSKKHALPKIKIAGLYRAFWLVLEYRDKSGYIWFDRNGEPSIGDPTVFATEEKARMFAENIAPEELAELVAQL